MTRKRNTSALSLSLVLLVGVAACGPQDSAEEPDTPAVTLAELVACNDREVGGDLVRAADTVRYDLHIVEPTFEVTGVYRATRSGTAAIDVYADGERVFSEGWYGDSGWQLHAGATDTVPTSPEAGAPLRHGLEQPGHLWTLADMEANGHQLALEPDSIPDDDRVTIRLTLSDGFQNWYTMDTESCRVVANRNFRAFHPDVDPEESWLETRFTDFERMDGILRARTTHNIDLATGDTIGTTTLRGVEVVPSSAND